MALRWSDFITPSTLQLAPLLELLIEPIRCLKLQGQVQLGLQEALVNAVRHGNGCDPAKCLRVRRIETPNWLVWQVQDEGAGVPPAARSTSLPEQLDAAGGRGLFLIHHCFDDVRWSNRGNRLQLAVSRQRASLLAPVGGWGNQDRSAQP
ncbi:MAG: ATP-binding protein [Cyanobium sp. MAG_04]|nr:ATP-binding protein [Cyanobium sp. MAG_04]